MVLEAPDLQEARRAAEAALVARSGDEARWTLGMLRPLTPMAPGTHRYRAHRLHHFRNERYWLGVATRFADQVLGTNPAKADVEVSPTAKTALVSR